MKLEPAAAAHEVPHPAHPSRRRKHRTRWGRMVLVLLVLAGALYLAGRGAGLLGGAELPDADARVGEDVAAGESGRAGGSADPAADATSSGSREVVDPHAVLAGAGSRRTSPSLGGPPASPPGSSGAVPTVPPGAPRGPTDGLSNGPEARSGSAAPESAESPELPEPIGLTDDRFFGWVALIEGHLDEGAMAEGAEALQRLRQQPLSAPQRSRLIPLTSRLVELRQAAESRVLKLLERGELLRAHREAKALCRSEPWAAGMLAERAPAMAWGGDWAASVAADGQPAADVGAASGSSARGTALPKPFGANRAMRLWWRDQLHRGSARTIRGNRVTVQVRDGGGQRFPTVAVVSCEPLDATAAECGRMGLWALQADEALLARLWLWRGMSLGASPASAELAPLAVQLRAQ
ncbi:MAG: hypothetical protein AB8H80_03240 [Planctomycetota bacterium]